MLPSCRSPFIIIIRKNNICIPQHMLGKDEVLEHSGLRLKTNLDYNFVFSLSPECSPVTGLTCWTEAER